jgi:hypothetical protein
MRGRGSKLYADLIAVDTGVVALHAREGVDQSYGEVEVLVSRARGRVARRVAEQS